jgi:hemolysin III
MPPSDRSVPVARTGVAVTGTHMEHPPLLRGVIHAAAVPVAVLGAVHLVTVANGTSAVVASVVYGATMILVYLVSATYHLLARHGIGRRVMQRADHCTIYFAIAGTYTPVCLFTLDGVLRWVMLGLVWAGAAAGATIKLAAFERANKLGNILYIVLGWAAISTVPALTDTPKVLVAVVAGGAVYTVAAVLFEYNWPRRPARWFGYHELWHTLVVAGGTICYVANRALIVSG